MDAEECYDAYKKPYRSYKLKKPFTFSIETGMYFVVIALDDGTYKLGCYDSENVLKGWSVILTVATIKPDLLLEALKNGSRGANMLQSKVFTKKEDGSLLIKVNNRVTDQVTPINMTVASSETSLSYSHFYLRHELMQLTIRTFLSMRSSLAKGKQDSDDE